MVHDLWSPGYSATIHVLVVANQLIKTYLFAAEN